MSEHAAVCADLYASDCWHRECEHAEQGDDCPTTMADICEACSTEDQAVLWETAERDGHDHEHDDDCPASDAPLSSCSRDDVCCDDCNHASCWPPAVTPIPVSEGQR